MGGALVGVDEVTGEMVGGIGMVSGDASVLKNVKNGPDGDIIPFFIVYLHSKRTIIMDMKILVKQGVGDIRFMMPVEEVVALLGTADEVENIDNVADEPTTVLRYNDLGLTLFFEGENPVLACIDICNEESEMLGEQVFEMEEPALVQLMVKNGYTEEDVDDEDWGERRVSFPEANVDFFFDEGELVSITLGA